VHHRAGAFKQQLLYQGGSVATERLHLLHGNPAVADTFEVMDVRTRRPLLLCSPFLFLCTVPHSISLVTHACPQGAPVPAQNCTS
jgi:hypothetical protein